MAKRKSRNKRFVEIKTTGTGLDVGFVMASNLMLHSEEVQGLSPNAFRLMIYLQGVYYPDKGRADLSVRQAAKFIGATDKTANKAFKELQQKGFIKVASPSQFAPKGQNKATGWLLTWCDTATQKASEYWNLEKRKVLENAAKVAKQTRAKINQLAVED